MGLIILGDLFFLEGSSEYFQPWRFRLVRAQLQHNKNFGFSVPLDKNGGLNRDGSLLDVVLRGLQCS